MTYNKTVPLGKGRKGRMATGSQLILSMAVGVHLKGYPGRAYSPLHSEAYKPNKYMNYFEIIRQECVYVMKLQMQYV